MKRVIMAGCALAVVSGGFVVSSLGHAQAQPVVTVPRECSNGVCGSSKYYGGRVRISVGSRLSRTTHFNFKTNPGAQIEIRGGYSFDQEPGRRGTYSVQACDRGGFGARSTCTRWATFQWRS
ncbi:hypothetical protein [Methylobacterium variabile]|uniref:hypothetical protein n=1 Tax=Methylobacterium variabile TaxID=298794 RepID=UPI0012ED64A7|nr:hypothetical protein [Methylobacterium variabile]